MATATELRTQTVSYMTSRKGKNEYTQGSKRKYFFGYPDNEPGNTKQAGFSDCSAAVRAAIKAATGIDIGSNTSAQINNRHKIGLIVHETDGYYPDESKLLPGDCLYFKGNTSHPLDVGHVEMYIGDGKVCGHGSGTGPKIRNMKDYCKSRANEKKRYFMAIRWIKDDGSEAPTKPTTSSTNSAYKGQGIGTAVSLRTMNVRAGAGTGNKSLGTIKKGTTVEVLEKLSNGWYNIVWPAASCGYAFVSNVGGKYFTYTANKTSQSTSSTSKPSGTKLKAIGAKHKDASLSGTYTTTAPLNLRTGPGTSYAVMLEIPEGDKVRCYGYYSKDKSGDVWLYVKYNGVVGFCSIDYLTK